MSRHAAKRAELAARLADQIVRHVRDIRFLRLEDAALAAAHRNLADEDIAAGLEAVPVAEHAVPILAAIDAQHQGRPWAGSSTGYVCTGGCGAYPCVTRRTLDGELVEVAS